MAGEPLTTMHCGDLFDVLPTFDADSFDALVADPPYGLGFMGKEWDTFKPGATDRQIEANPHIHSANPNLKNRRQTPSKSTSNIEYDRSVRGQREFQAWCERWGWEVIRVLKPGAHILVCGAPRSHHRMISGLEDAGFEIRDCLAWLFGQGFPKSLNLPGGLGTALKPAHEPIVLARKPLIGTVAANVERFTTGALNIDACRIDHVLVGNGNLAENPQLRGTKERSAPVSSPFGSGGEVSDLTSPLGRWPSNVLLDEASAALLDEQSGELTSGAYSGDRNADSARAVYGGFSGTARWEGTSRSGDSGGASRFFYVAKPGRAERDRGCDALEPRQRDDSRKEGNPGGDNPRNRGLDPRANHHPTVKPVELMRYLVRLVTPPGGVVLDCFAGSGTTGMACAFEGVSFVGVEREPAYVAIAERRIASVLPLFGSPAQADVLCGKGPA